MSLFNGLDKSEKRLILAALAVFAVCMYLLFFNGEIFRSGRSSHGKQIGTFLELQNDTRFKPNDTIGWGKARKKEIVESGDSLFSGDDSYAVVDMTSGGKLTVGSNSLVVFREFSNMKLADLQDGNFRLHVQGTVKIAIKGEVTTLEGTDSEVQLVTTPKAKPIIRLLRGKTTVKQSHATKPIVIEDSRELASLDFPSLTPPSAPTPAAAVETPTDLSIIGNVPYTWRLYDIYQQRDFQLFPRSQIPDMFSVSLKLSWSQPETVRTAHFELANASDFKRSMKLDASDGSLVLPQAFLGANFWRVSLDGTHWSKSGQFHVQGTYLSDGRPFAVARDDTIPLLGLMAEEKVALSSSIDHIGFVVEAATDDLFREGHTRTFWSKNSVIALSFYKPGKYYYRFRAVNPKQELTDWSEPLVFSVFSPQRPTTPLLLINASNEGLIGDHFRIGYSSKADSTGIEISNERGDTVARFNSANADFRPLASGRYKAVAVARDRYGQRSPPSKPASFTVRDKVLPIAQEKPKPVQNRKPSAVESSSTVKISNKLPSYINETYKDSSLSVQGFLWGMYSGEQVESGSQEPVATGVAIRGLHWWNHSGVEGLLSSEVFGLNQTGSDMWLKDAEARYHFRFLTPFPFGLARELQISLFAGLEFYQNTNPEFMESYDLMTFGTSLEFPLGNRWTTGGEITYGYSPFDGSTKYEITGNLNYFFEKAWSFGVGYKVHLFQAGSSAAPGGYLLYREGYTEGFTSLDYHF